MDAKKRATAMKAAAAGLFSQCPADKEGTPLRRRSVPRNRGHPGGAQVQIGLEIQRQPDAGRLEGKLGSRMGRRDERDIRRFAGIVLGAGAVVIRLLLVVLPAAAAAVGALLRLLLPEFRGATAQRAGDQEGQQASEDGSKTRHRW